MVYIVKKNLNQKNYWNIVDKSVAHERIVGGFSDKRVAERVTRRFNILEGYTDNANKDYNDVIKDVSHAKCESDKDKIIRKHINKYHKR